MKKLILNSITFTFILVLLVSCSSDNESNSSSSDEAVKSYTHSVAELELLDEVNNYRVSIGLNPLEIIAWKQIFYYLEKCSDACEDVADVVESVIMKNS